MSRCAIARLVLAALLAALPGFEAAADDEAARRDLLQQALAKQLSLGHQAPDDASWPMRMAFVTRMIARHPDAKSTMETAESWWRVAATSSRRDAIRGGFLSADPSAGMVKRLEDQALIADAFLDAVQIAGDDAFREAARTTLDFVIKDLPLAEGGFAAAARRHPLRDETFVPSANGLLVAALAHGHAVLGGHNYYVTAERTEEFLRTRCITAEDCIAAIHGAFSLYQTAGSARWLATAIELQDRLDREFWDEATISYRGIGPGLLTDGLVILNLLRLAAITDDDHFRDRANALLATALKQMNNDHAPGLGVLCAIDQQLGPNPHLTIVGDPAAAETRALFTAAQRSYQPRLVIVTCAGDSVQAQLRKRFPAMVPVPAVDGKSTAYVCTGMMCNRPATDPAMLERQLADISYRW